MLNDPACKNAKPREKAYKLSDEKGLYLEIMPTGSKYFRLKYRFLDGAEWRIPAEKMKMRDPHIIPLSTQALSVL